METEEIILVVMGILLLAWVLYGVIRIFRRIKKAASGITIPAWVQCEKCGAVFAVPAENVMRGGMMKSARKTQTIIRGGYVVRQPVYKSYAKKCDCQSCGNRTWGQVQNLAELQREIRPISVKETLRGILLILIGGGAILAVAGIFYKLLQQF